ncbi:hypothetical protein CHGG_10985 [Chaetomium globosum CBS 148.51]|uniref:Helicase C-terminal domain-containing protein n=1 Tax=Chaetomium globosum (strain ATCC 6205 / CBS 148.51 / DSM 1962 / NBRC 6347 / NRRL 1970) TaxID=306901 RepID=Q2GM19_CHAGB|nr:uncharacterized protein CHGG_10985 [Chaetomium globosum CBS 148.51]EAQ83167.1 hypothetical protein CHGG_10985 [Chaetomium globosum CBS 148.51]
MTNTELSPFYKLTTLSVSVVRGNDSQHLSKPLTYFIREPIKQDGSYDPEVYSWDEFEDLLVYRLNFNCHTEVVVFCQYGSDSKETRRLEVTDEHVWLTLLLDITKNNIVVSEYGQLYFNILPQKNHQPSKMLGNWPQEDFEGIFDDWVVVRSRGPWSRSRSPTDSSRRTVMEVVEYEIESDEEDTAAHNKHTDQGAVADLHRFVYEGVDGEMSDDDTLTSDSESNYSQQEGPTTPTFPESKVGSLSEKPIVPRKTVSTVATRGKEKARGGAATRGTAPTRGNPPTRGLPISRPTTAWGIHPTTRGGTRGGRGTIGGTKAASPPRTKPTPTTTTTPPPPPPPIPPQTPPAPETKATPTATYLNLIDLAAAEYQTASVADADYGAVDLDTTVDAYVGSYNAGNSEAEWSACLDYFKVHEAEWRKRESIAAVSKGGRVRVPMKKLQGTMVGLFDYQLMGVLKLMTFVLGDVSGGLLCDEQGLGKTQEMYGLMAFAHSLRKCKNEVQAAWRKSAKAAAKPGGKQKGGSVGQHNPPGKEGARLCPFDDRYRFRCYCYSELTRQLADRLPDGPNILVAPARNCASTVRDAKLKLDTKVFKIRGFHEGGDKEDKLTPAEVQKLRPIITPGEDGNCKYQAGLGQSDYIIIVSPEFIPRLMTHFAMKVSGGVGKMSGLLPGMILMDEFHEYAIAKDCEESRIEAWLQHLKKCCLDSNQPTPLTYFVSGTPFGETPADIHPTISFLEKEVWKDENHRLNGATVASFDALVDTFNKLTRIQADGETVPTPDIVDYRHRLDRVLKPMMLRRLGTDQFQGRNLTDVGPLKVNITDHNLPSHLTDDMQALANRTRDLAAAAAAKQGIPLPRFLRSKAGEAIFLKLRLASTFPGIAAPSSAEFNFNIAEIHANLAAARFDVTKTPYHELIPAWSAGSPKLETLTQTIATMLNDKSPIPGAPSVSKKLCIFTPLEAEAVLLQSYLLLKRTHPAFRHLKPILLHSSLSQTERQRVLDSFLTEGNFPPNVLVTPVALAGTGLNLQRARYSTVTGPAWTKRENQQAYYRIHRVGQRQETRLGLLTSRWNPAERVVLGAYEGRGVEGDGLGEEVWEVGNRFCAAAAEEAKAGGKGGMVERHQGARVEDDVERREREKAEKIAEKFSFF